MANMDRADDHLDRVAFADRQVLVSAVFLAGFASMSARSICSAVGQHGCVAIDNADRGFDYRVDHREVSRQKALNSN
jgi:hypothetical protein